jgi:hypothetical protein
MNKIKNILILLAVCLTTLANAQKIQKEYFTTIDKLFYVEIGMTSNEVQSTLGVDPFDFYQNLAEGEMIVEYRYLHKKLQIKSKDNNYVKSKGEDYFTDASSIYCTFDTDKKLLAFYTDSGSENSEEAYIWENTIKQVNTNPDCSNTCVIVTEKNDEEPKELIEETIKTDSKKKKRRFRK